MSRALHRLSYRTEKLRVFAGGTRFAFRRSPRLSSLWDNIHRQQSELSRGYTHICEDPWSAAQPVFTETHGGGTPRRAAHQESSSPEGKVGRAGGGRTRFTGLRGRRSILP